MEISLEYQEHRRKKKKKAKPCEVCDGKFAHYPPAKSVYHARTAKGGFLASVPTYMHAIPVSVAFVVQCSHRSFKSLKRSLYHHFLVNTRNKLHVLTVYRMFYVFRNNYIPHDSLHTNNFFITGLD